MKELSGTPRTIQKQAEVIVFEELKSNDPFRIGYVEQMTGYHNKFKIRIGKYRIGLTIEKKAKLIICQRILHRKDIYRVFP